MICFFRGHKEKKRIEIVNVEFGGKVKRELRYGVLYCERCGKELKRQKLGSKK